MATYTPWSNLRSVTIIGNPYPDAMEPFISLDGSILFFNNSNVTPANTVLSYATYAGPNAFQYRGLVGGIQTPGNLVGVPSMDINNNFFYDNTTTSQTIWTGVFSAGSVASPAAVSGINAPSGFLNIDSFVSPPGTELYYSQQNTSTQATQLILATGSVGTWTPSGLSTPILTNVNNAGANYAACISADATELYWTRFNSAVAPFPQIYTASRGTSPPGQFGLPQLINGPVGYVEGPSLGYIGGNPLQLYFHQQDPVSGHFSIYVLTRSFYSPPQPGLQPTTRIPF